MADGGCDTVWPGDGRPLAAECLWPGCVTSCAASAVPPATTASPATTKRTTITRPRPLARRCAVTVSPLLAGWLAQRALQRGHHALLLSWCYLREQRQAQQFSGHPLGGREGAGRVVQVGESLGQVDGRRVVDARTDPGRLE